MPPMIYRIRAFQVNKIASDHVVDNDQNKNKTVEIKDFVRIRHSDKCERLLGVDKG